MSRRSGGWTCQRTSSKKKCGFRNPSRTRKCQKCGKPRPARRRPEHMKALDVTYEEYIIINGSETCGICGRPPSDKRRLDRDHDHKSGIPRGLLCPRCNRALVGWKTPEWLRAAAEYLERKHDGKKEQGRGTPNS